MAREIHFYTSYRLASQEGVELADMLLIGWDSAEEAIRRRKNLKQIHTLQMGLLKDAWEKHCAYGDRVFIHDGAGVFELTEECTRTNRRLKRYYNAIVDTDAYYKRYNGDNEPLFGRRGKRDGMPRMDLLKVKSDLKKIGVDYDALVAEGEAAKEQK